MVVTASDDVVVVSGRATSDVEVTEVVASVVASVVVVVPATSLVEVDVYT